MGYSRWKSHVRIFIDTLSDTLPHGVKNRPDYITAKMGSSPPALLMPALRTVSRWLLTHHPPSYLRMLSMRR